MNMIQHAGGSPANFMDIGGGASPDRVAKAFRLVCNDDKVQAILVNIFAGINRCDWGADGIVQALDKIDLGMPLVVGWREPMSRRDVTSCGPAASR